MKYQRPIVESDYYRSEQLYIAREQGVFPHIYILYIYMYGILLPANSNHLSAVSFMSDACWIHGWKLRFSPFCSDLNSL